MDKTFTGAEIGELNNEHAEILGGLEEDDQVVLYPSDSVSDDTRLVDRAL